MLTSATARWATHPEGDIPANAIQMGRAGRSTLYLGRVAHHGGLYPASVDSATKQAVFILHGQQVVSKHFELLVSAWERQCNGGILPTAEPLYTRGTQPFYLIRARHRNRIYEGVVGSGATAGIIHSIPRVHVRCYEILTGHYTRHQAVFLKNHQAALQLAPGYTVCLAQRGGLLQVGRVHAGSGGVCELPHRRKTRRFKFLVRCG